MPFFPIKFIIKNFRLYFLSTKFSKDTLMNRILSDSNNTEESLTENPTHNASKKVSKFLLYTLSLVSHNISIFS